MATGRTFDELMAMNYTTTYEDVPMTKAIAHQILLACKVTHKGTNYQLKTEEILPADKLAYFLGRYSWSQVARDWDSYPGDDASSTMQGAVDSIIAKARVATVSMDVAEARLDVISKANVAKSYSIVDGTPLVTDAFGFVAYRTATHYFMLNPPFTKGEQISTPVEAAATKAYYVPKTTKPMREFNKTTSKWEGFFEAAYRVGHTVTISDIEAVLTYYGTTKGAELLNKVIGFIGPVYNDSPTKYHRVFNLTKERFTIDRSKARPTVAYNYLTYWQGMIYFHTMSRIKNVYEPFYCCLLPRGMPQRVHVVSGLKWLMRQVGVSGISGASSSSEWLNVKSMAVLNIAISSSASTKVLVPRLGDQEPGEYSSFYPVMEIIDMENLSSPTASKTSTIAFSPAQPQSKLEALERLFLARGHDHAKIKMGVVAYLHPSLWRVNWGIYPLNLGDGKVICFYGQTGYTCDFMLDLYGRFCTYRMLFPYTRVPWPRHGNEISYPPVILKNGVEAATKYIGLLLDFGDEESLAEVEPMNLDEIEKYKPQPPPQFPQVVALHDEIPVPDAVIPQVVSAPEEVAPALGAATPAPQPTGLSMYDDAFDDYAEMDTKTFTAALADRKKKPAPAPLPAMIGGGPSPMVPPEGYVPPSKVTVATTVQVVDDPKASETPAPKPQEPPNKAPEPKAPETPTSKPQEPPKKAPEPKAPPKKAPEPQKKSATSSGSSGRGGKGSSQRGRGGGRNG